MADIKKFLDRDGVSTLWSKVAQSVAAEKARAEAAEKANAEAIAGIKNGAAMNDFAAVEAKIATLQVAGDYSVNGHKHEIADVNGLQDALDSKGAKTVVEANAAAIEVLEGKVEALEAGTYDDTEVRGLIKDNADAIDALEGTHATDKAALEASIKSNADAIALLTNGVDADVIDGVNDLINYVNEHGTEVTGIKADIAANAGGITALEGRMSDVEAANSTQNGLLEGLRTDVDAKAAQADLDSAVTRVKALEDAEFTNVNDVVNIVGTAYNTAKEEMAQIVADADVVVLTEAKAHADGLNTAMDGRVATLESASHSHNNKDVLDGISSTKVAAWDAAEANAKAHADGLASDLDIRVQTLENIDHTKFEAAGAAATAEANAKAYTDTEFAKIQALTTAEIEAAIAAAQA